jgi:hypothetical protein
MQYTSIRLAGKDWKDFQSCFKMRAEIVEYFGGDHGHCCCYFLEPPPTPQNLSILEIQSRSVKVAWNVEMASPGVDRLVVQWKEQSGKSNFSAFSLFSTAWEELGDGSTVGPKRPKCLIITCNFYYGNVLSCSVVSFAFCTCFRVP